MRLFASTALARANNKIEFPATAAIWFDAADLDSLRQEITGASATTPVAVGDPVGSWFNRGTVGGWATAPNNATRPILAQSGGLYYLKAEGASEVRLNLTVPQSSAMTTEGMVTAGMYADTTGTILGGAGTGSGEDFTLGFQGSSRVRFGTFGDALDSPTNVAGQILVASCRTRAVERYIRINGAQVAADVPANPNNESQGQLFSGILSRGSGELRLYTFIGRGASITDRQRNADEQFAAWRTGLLFQST